MRSKKIHWPIELPKKSAFAIDTPPDINKLHCLMLLSGKRGGGKSVAVASYVKKLRDLDLMQRVLLITPTYNSNKEIFAPLKLNADEDVLEPTTDALQRVISIVEKEKKEYDEFLEKKKKYRQFQKYLNSNTPIEGIPSDLLLSLMDGDFGPPKYKYKDESHPPRLFLIIDDCMGSDLFKPRGGLVQFCIKHRHIADGLGISVAMLVQSYCAVGEAHAGIVPKIVAVRQSLAERGPAQCTSSTYAAGSTQSPNAPRACAPSIMPRAASGFSRKRAC